MTANTDRSWKHMLDLGATIAFEAWDVKYKKNMDRNHAWGAAPANILPRHVLGVRPTVPGAERIVIAPQPGNLRFVRGSVPIRQGPVVVDYDLSQSRFEVTIPEGVTAQVAIGEQSIEHVTAGNHTFPITDK